MGFAERAEKLIAVSDRFKVFPLLPNSKVPAIPDYAHAATRDPLRIKAWSEKFPDANVGLPTDELLAVDIDAKGKHSGYESLLELGIDFPPTFRQKTPSGGEHLIYFSPTPVRCGVGVLGPGIDIRGAGGYGVGGSEW